MPAASAASSTVGDLPSSTSRCAIAMSVVRVRSFCLVLPCDRRSSGMSFDLYGTTVLLWYSGTMKTIVRDDGEGEQLWFHGGGIHTWKVTAEETHGMLGIF